MEITKEGAQSLRMKMPTAELYYSTVVLQYSTVVCDGLHEPYLLLTNSSFILILSDSCRGCLIWVKLNLSKFRSKNLKASLMSFTCSLFSDKVRCFNQSKRALYENFIINQIKAYRTGYQTIPNFSQLLNASSSVSTSHCK